MTLTLLQELKNRFPDSSNNTLRSWIEKGRVQVNGRLVERSNHPLIATDEVVVGPRVAFAREGIKILFEDESIVVLEKPAGLLSVATDFQDTPSVHSILKKRRKADVVYPVHRLDRETSGVMMFAYTPFARDHLKQQFFDRKIFKEYEALVEGNVPVKQGRWESFLEEDPFYFVASTGDDRRGKLAVTAYEVIGSDRRFSLLRLVLHTGRKNQLRVHCSEAGFPIAGDKKYGAVTNPHKRLCLHARKLTFEHPALAKQMTFEAPTPFL